MWMVNRNLEGGCKSFHNMARKPFLKCNPLLYPFTWLYGAGVALRNRCFDLNIRKSKEFDLPVISVGNISVGGTGKTPHTEYLIRLIDDFENTAVLSRGYKRKSKGFRKADINSSALDIGDEPYQIKQKFPDVTVAVDAKRVHGIEQLLNQSNPPKYILLDDAYQHRQVKAGMSILLMEQQTVHDGDSLLPYGRLREPLSNRDRADIIIVTKCADGLRPVDFMTMRKTVDAFPYQSLYFSCYKYSVPKPVFAAKKNQLIELKGKKALVVTGIANPTPLYDYLDKQLDERVNMRFSDHYFFSKSDYKKMQERFDSLQGDKILLFTEKDVSRILKDKNFPIELKPFVYSIEIEVAILNGRKNEFEAEIKRYVKTMRKRSSASTPNIQSKY